MSALRQSCLWLTAVAVVLAADAQTTTVPLPKHSAVVSTNIMPPTPSLQSPVTFFRQLLLMSAAERNQTLTNRTPEIRAKILAKVREYQVLNPDERELRLRATELRWYLTPLMRVAPGERPADLSSVPPELRDLVQARLAQWDLLPPPVQQEFLANEKTLHYFARVELTTTAPATTPEQQKLADQFNQFFELTPAEKQHALNSLSTAERTEMEKTLKTFDQLPLQQRALCLRNYAKFTSMTVAERAEFLKNAESWSKMSPTERQAWRDLVARVPLWPPMPPAIMPPVPHSIVPHVARTNVANN